MPTAPQPNLLRRLMGAAPEPAAIEVDPADMGTAMGLDFCLDEAPASVTPTAPATASQADWLRRLSAS